MPQVIPPPGVDGLVDQHAFQRPAVQLRGHHHRGPRRPEGEGRAVHHALPQAGAPGQEAVPGVVPPQGDGLGHRPPGAVPAPHIPGRQHQPHPDPNRRHHRLPGEGGRLHRLGRGNRRPRRGIDRGHIPQSPAGQGAGFQSGAAPAVPAPASPHRDRPEAGNTGASSRIRHTAHRASRAAGSSRSPMARRSRTAARIKAVPNRAFCSSWVMSHPPVPGVQSGFSAPRPPPGSAPAR